MKPVGVFKCPSGHVLGLVVRNGSKVRQLVLYRQAVEMSAEVVEEVDVVAVIEGQAIDIRCSVCGKTRRWVEALR